ncbi:hypothetical protein WHR41_03162 [Cladosporium halotolerans]|uniref:Uncharacterized protein n=1 Tax=Cladosporium halotolerans TaxID=1052096 RepID=A0AB34KWA5_9PEZI
MATTDLKALRFPFKDPKFIFFTDFDGTITLKDSNDYMTDTIGYGAEKRKQGNKDVLDGKKNFRDAFREMMDSITRPFPQCVDYLVENITLDPHFNEYFQWALANNIPTVVVSSGMTPVIRGILQKLVGPDCDKIDIVCNEAVPRDGKSLDEEGGWQIQYHDDSGFGHDKSLTLRPYAQLPADKRPTLFYAGDGVSDLSAARETDLLFAKKGHDLITYCARENVPFTVFEDWSSILATVKQIVAGERSVQDAASQGFADYKAGKAGVEPIAALNGNAK